MLGLFTRSKVWSDGRSVSVSSTGILIRFCIAVLMPFCLCIAPIDSPLLLGPFVIGHWLVIRSAYARLKLWS